MQLAKIWFPVSLAGYIIGLLVYGLDINGADNVDFFWALNKYAAFIGASYAVIKPRTVLQRGICLYLLLLTALFLLQDITGVILGNPDWIDNTIYFWVTFSLISSLGMVIYAYKAWRQKK